MLLITGASGFVGQHLLKFLKEHAPAVASDILPVYRSSSIAGGTQVDLTDAAAVAQLFNRFDITSVIHLAAEARPAVCETDPETAHKTNVTAVQTLLQACRANHCYFLYTSTDMVFAGTRELYLESDEPDPINSYGRMKAEAESLVKMYSGPWCIVRPALIYGGVAGGKASFLSWMLQAVETGSGHFFTDERRSPVWVNDLVALMVRLVEIRFEGTIHAGGLDCLSRVDFAEYAAETWGLSRSNIKTVSLAADPANAWRPRSVCLASERAHQLVPFHTTRSALERIRSEGSL